MLYHRRSRVNHNGSLEQAKKLINVAKDSGADAVKFQTFHADKLVTLTAEKLDIRKLQHPRRNLNMR